MTTELNARVAAELMGWLRPLNTGPDEDWTITNLRCAKWWQAPDGSYHEHPPDYSGDWAAFGSLLEKLAAESAEKFQPPIGMLVGGAGVARARVNGEAVDNHDIRKALCRAALKAREARE